MVVEDWNNLLQKHGCRLTAPRRAVVKTLVNSNRALTPVEAYEEARKQCPSLGLVSVYRTLEKLEELGLIQRVHQTKNCQAFIRSGEGHQHLLICSKCGNTVYFNGDQLGQLFYAISKSTGFYIENHWLQAYGLCKSCQAVS